MNRVPPTRLLSSSPFLFKRVVPPLLVVAILMMVISELTRNEFGGAAVIAFVGAIAFLITRVMMSAFADEVLDGGDLLRVKHGDIQEDVPLCEIEAVRETIYGRRPPRIELILFASGRLGRVISFIPFEYSCFRS